MTAAHLVSQFLYAGKTLADVAGWDDRQMLRVVCLPRNSRGEIVTDDADLPQWVKDTTDEDGWRVVKNPKPFGAMFREVKRKQGKSEQEAESEWTAYVGDVHGKRGR